MACFAAFDIGSGAIKVQVANVENGEIRSVLFTDMVQVPLREDLAKSLDGRLSDEIQNKTVNAIVDLMKKVQLYHPSVCMGFGTAAFREAINGKELAEKIQAKTGLTVRIISQEEEAKLGYLSAARENTDVVWDLGGGSFQMATNTPSGFSFFNGNIGKVSMKKAILRIQNKNEGSPNPISKQDATLAHEWIQKELQASSKEFREKISSTVILAVGINPMWGIKTEFTQDDVLRAISDLLNCDDSAIRTKYSLSPDKNSEHYLVSNLILAYGIMQAFGIQSVRYVGNDGGITKGALLSL